MDKNTFWSHTAPSFELIDYEEGTNFEILDAEYLREASYTAIVERIEDEQSIEIRVFRTATTTVSQDRRERKFQWFNKNR